MLSTLLNQLSRKRNQGKQNNHTSSRKFNVFAMPAGYSGCAFWRFRTPLAKIQAIGSDKIDVVVSKQSGKHANFSEVAKYSDKADLIHMQAPSGTDAITLMNLYHSQGKKVLIDYDDFSFDLSPGNPRYAELGIREAEELSEDGKTKFKWRDQENGFNLKANIAKYESFLTCLRTADGITTTTEYLADKFRPYNENVFICPNSIDMNLWKPIPRRPGTENHVRIGWFGGDSHYADLKCLKTILPTILNRHEQARLVFQCPPVPEWNDIFQTFPADRIYWHNWVDLNFYTLILSSHSFDIGICPLADNDFNKCKSAIKMLEFAALRVPVVAQNMTPYKEVIKHGVTGFLADSDKEWIEYLDMLVENSELRAKMGEAAYQDVLQNHNLDKNIKFWEQAYLRTIHGQT